MVFSIFETLDFSSTFAKICFTDIHSKCYCNIRKGKHWTHLAFLFMGIINFHDFLPTCLVFIIRFFQGLCKLGLVFSIGTTIMQGGARVLHWYNNYARWCSCFPVYNNYARWCSCFPVEQQLCKVVLVFSISTTIMQGGARVFHWYNSNARWCSCFPLAQQLSLTDVTRKQHRPELPTV